MNQPFINNIGMGIHKLIQSIRSLSSDKPDANCDDVTPEAASAIDTFNAEFVVKKLNQANRVASQIDSVVRNISYDIKKLVSEIVNMNDMDLMNFKIDLESRELYGFIICTSVSIGFDEPAFSVTRAASTGDDVRFINLNVIIPIDFIRHQREWAKRGDSEVRPEPPEIDEAYERIRMVMIELIVEYAGQFIFLVDDAKCDKPDLEKRGSARRL